MSKRDESSEDTSVRSWVAGIDDRNIVWDVDDPPTEVFRGFESEPAVVVEQLDLSASVTSTRRRSILKKTQAPVLNSFTSTCTVSLFRDDLQQLKELFSKNPKLYNSPMASPDRGSFKCKVCKKVYSNEKKLQNHQENKHMIVYKPKTLKRVSFSDKIIVHEVKEYHKCRKCPRIFESYKLLKSHMKDQHKKRKCYICNYCNKKFVDRMFFKVHIKLHCEVCGLLLPNKAKYLDHKRNVCRVLKLHTCKTCNLSFFKFMDLKDHSYEHISTCYVCDICKDQCSTKCAIAHHIYYLHSRKCKRHNPSLYLTRKLGSESLYLCKFCDESSVDKELIEKHVGYLPDLSNRTMTGYKDFYFCDQCLKKFGTEQDMLQHKWTHFLKTSDNSQLRLRDVDKDQDMKTVHNINNTVNSSNDDSNSILKSLLRKATDTKRFYHILYEKIPEHFQPRVVLERMKIKEKLLDDIAFVDINSIDVTSVTCQQQSTVVTKGTVYQPPQTINVTTETETELCHSVPVTNGTVTQENHSIDVTNGTGSQHPDIVIDPKTKIKCRLCNKLVKFSYLKRHIQYVHQKERYECSLCNKWFRHVWLFNEHKCAQYGAVQPIYNPGRVEAIPDINGDTNSSQEYMDIDFDIPAPIVEITEYENELNHQFQKTDSSDSNIQEIKTVYNVNEKIPENFQPKVLLVKMSVEQMLADYKLSGCYGNAKKRTRTILSNHQCPTCGKYYSSNYCLNRHIETQHSDLEKLQCKVCEEVFVWPSLLQRHKCIRLPIPEMPFQDARPEILFDNLHDIQRPLESANPEIVVNSSNFDDLNIAESDNYMNSVDFEIPAPVVELTEYEDSFSMNRSQVSQNVSDKIEPLQHLGYTIVHEVPIEF